MVRKSQKKALTHPQPPQVTSNVPWPRLQGHTLPSMTAGWCQALSVGRSCPCFPQIVGMEEPLLELARVPACSDSHPERRRGAEASL